MCDPDLDRLAKCHNILKCLQTKKKPNPQKNAQNAFKIEKSSKFSKAKLSSYNLPPYITQTYLHFSPIGSIYKKYTKI